MRLDHVHHRRRYRLLRSGWRHRDQESRLSRIRITRYRSGCVMSIAISSITLALYASATVEGENLMNDAMGGSETGERESETRDNEIGHTLRASILDGRADNIIGQMSWLYRTSERLMSS